MSTVTVSPKFQVVIPRDVREQLHVEAGQQFQVIALAGRIELLPVVPPRSIRGLCPAISTEVERDERELP